ncbi:hypothetical protein F0U61_48865 [Archangium violaceum]|uniref:hypothetical protein n=1 Tax=Archangium violaceum TaxID=83451 RepID=UPI002B2BD824|nr:hypothetical protein F0U61_48865 [Archangium violaceum]
MALTVTYQGYTPACLRVTAEDAAAPERRSDNLIEQSKLASDEDRKLIIAVYRQKNWSEQLQVEVASYATPDCTGTAIETRRLPSAVTLSAKGSEPAALALLAKDDDGDGYPAETKSDSAIQGTDCDDGKANVYPGAKAACDEKDGLNTDFNCDEKLDCNGANCSGFGDEKCGSGHCVEGICCNTACNPQGQCYSATCATGTCQEEALPSTTACDDGLACTSPDKCDGAGACISTEYCPPPNECKKNGSCANDGSCRFEVDASMLGKVCHENGNTGTCLQDGTCRWFKYAVTGNFTPADIATNNTIEDLEIACATTFDSTALTWTSSQCSFATPTPVTTSADVVVIPVRNLTVNAPLRMVGSRPVVFAVYGDATLNSEIRANSVFAETQVGAGSEVRCGGRTGGEGLVADDASGGGGGGLATKGGNGGTTDGGLVGGLGGAAAGSGFSPLMGGCRGGNGLGANPTKPGAGGAGGGALQISVAGRLTLKSVVTVSGAGGKGGNSANNKTASGGGGGSGGMLVLEADQLVADVAARLTANGGGGGEGGSIAGVVYYNGNNGVDGSTSTVTRANGGAGGGDYGGDGGQGAAGSSGPSNGGNGSGEHGAGGGGGGAAGRILLRGVTSCSVDTGSIISPAPIKTGGACP